MRDSVLLLYLLTFLVSDQSLLEVTPPTHTLAHRVCQTVKSCAYRSYLGPCRLLTVATLVLVVCVP